MAGRIRRNPGAASARSAALLPIEKFSTTGVTGAHHRGKLEAFLDPTLVVCW